MTDNPPHFLLVGNGPYSNLGCEAIVRGTTEILLREFGDRLRLTVASFGAPAKVEADERIRHVSAAVRTVRRWSLKWWRRQACRLTGRMDREDAASCHWLAEPAHSVWAALQIGGDNYTLDYGRPQEFMTIDRYLFAQRVPVVLWGASVGPFDSDPYFRARMYKHLTGMRAILVREGESHRELTRHGLDGKVHLVADPAFAMKASLPKPYAARAIPTGAVGMNFSPLMARYVTKGDLPAWTRLCAETTRTIARATKRPVVLIPHVTTPRIDNDDLAFLREVWRAVASTGECEVTCLSEPLSAAEAKWAIAQCVVFVGARTHATIAAISSRVPTISLAYSRKAKGLNEDVFGGQQFCIEPQDISPESIAHRTLLALTDRDGIRRRLAARLPSIEASAFEAGPILRAALGSSPPMS